MCTAKDYVLKFLGAPVLWQTFWKITEFYSISALIYKTGIPEMKTYLRRKVLTCYCKRDP